MAEEKKKFYWLKLKRDFFKRHDVRIIKNMENGKDYIIFYLELLCESLDHEGKLRFSEGIPYNENMLATITDTNVDIVRSAIRLFQELKLIEIWDDGTYYMTRVQEMIGSYADNDNARRQREFYERQKQKALGERYEGVRKPNESIENRVKSEEIEKEKEKDSVYIPPTPSTDNNHDSYDDSYHDSRAYIGDCISNLFSEEKESEESEEGGETRKKQEEKKVTKENKNEKAIKSPQEGIYILSPTPLKDEKPAAYHGLKAHDVASEYQARFNSIDGVVKCRRMTVKREMAVDTILHNFTIEQINRAFDKVAKSDYLHGLNRYSWVVSFDWLFDIDHFTKVMEGNYDNRKGTGSNKGFKPKDINGQYDNFEAEVVTAL